MYKYTSYISIVVSSIIFMYLYLFIFCVICIQVEDVYVAEAGVPFTDEEIGQIQALFD